MSKEVKSWICTTCGTQYEAAVKPPKNCPICKDERQFVNWNGQEWTTISDLQSCHQNVFKPQGPGITGIGITPKFAIGQRALLVQTRDGNLLWDCISLIDEATTQAVQALGGFPPSLSPIRIITPRWQSGAKNSATCLFIFTLTTDLG